MSPNISKSIFIILLFYVIAKPQNVHGQPQVPCLFFFGDSQIDNGNNNNLLTLAKVNYFPYGIDYMNGTATGRFNNGKNVPDFIAEFLGFNRSIPPFATARGAEILQGVNYGSGASGILDETGLLNQGARISLNRQLLNHATTVANTVLRFGPNATRAREHLNRCLYFVNAGNNDYLNNYFQPQYISSVKYTPDQFAERLITNYSRQLRTLYDKGARKVAINGAGLLGCVPQILSMFPVNPSGCVDRVNAAVQLFNNRLKPLVDELNNNLTNAQFILINTTSISLGDPSVIGIRVTNAPCCQVTQPTGLCLRGSQPCPNRDEYLFWDNFHQTEIGNRASATRSYRAALPTDAYPCDISTLVQM